MNRFWYRGRMLVLCPALCLLSPLAGAVEIGGNADLDLRYTDNATLQPSNTTSDLVTTASIGGTVRENTGPLTGSAIASLRHLNYKDGSYDNQDYFDLDAYADWEQIKNVLKWSLRDYYSQASINNLAADTPTNTENINAVNASGQLTLQPLDRHTLTLTPSIDKYTYGTSGNDNRQAGIAANWAYQFSPTIVLSLNSSYRDVKYDDKTLAADHTSTSAGVGVAVVHSRAEYYASTGVSSIDRSVGSSFNGSNAALSALFRLSARSTVNANFTSDITDTSSIYLDSALDPNSGNYGNIQTSNDVLRNSLLRVAYNRAGTNLDLSGWLELRKLDYNIDNNLDRKVQDLGASAGYRLTPKMTVSVQGSMVESKLQNPSTTDRFYSASGRVGYALSRRLDAHAGVSLQSRTNPDPLSEYDEYSVFAGVGYRLGRQ